MFPSQRPDMQKSIGEKIEVIGKLAAKSGRQTTIAEGNIDTRNSFNPLLNATCAGMIHHSFPNEDRGQSSKGEKQIIQTTTNMSMVTLNVRGLIKLISNMS